MGKPINNYRWSAALSKASAMDYSCQSAGVLVQSSRASRISGPRHRCEATDRWFSAVQP